MPDYYPLIARAVAELPENTLAARGVLYDRARNALLARLSDQTPKLDDAAIARERRALDEAIRKAEAERAQVTHTAAVPGSSGADWWTSARKWIAATALAYLAQLAGPYLVVTYLLASYFPIGWAKKDLLEHPIVFSVAAVFSVVWIAIYLLIYAFKTRADRVRKIVAMISRITLVVTLLRAGGVLFSSLLIAIEKSVPFASQEFLIAASLSAFVVLTTGVIAISAYRIDLILAPLKSTTGGRADADYYFLK